MSEESDYRKLRYCAYRFCYAIRNDLTPRQKIRWGVWFERKFKISIDDYHLKVLAAREKRNASALHKE